VLLEFLVDHCVTCDFIVSLIDRGANIEERKDEVPCLLLQIGMKRCRWSFLTIPCVESGSSYSCIVDNFVSPALSYSSSDGGALKSELT
jgi:hypothetical protein